MISENPKKVLTLKVLTQNEIDLIVAKAKESIQHLDPEENPERVGVCLLASDGTTFQGTKVQTYSLRGSIHAEASVISKAVTEGNRDFKAIAIYSSSDKLDTMDCFYVSSGEIRQYLAEFSMFMPVIFVHKNGSLMYEFLHELLPLQFRLGDTSSKPQNIKDKYDYVLNEANKWILKDPFSKTRQKMTELLEDWKFDLIFDLFSKQISCNYKGEICATYGPGPNSLNPLMVQKISNQLGPILKPSNEEEKENQNLKVLIGYEDNGTNCITQMAEICAASLMSQKIKAQLSDKISFNLETKQLTILNQDGKSVEQNDFGFIVLFHLDKQDEEETIIIFNIIRPENPEDKNSNINKQYLEKALTKVNDSSLVTIDQLKSYFDYNQGRLIDFKAYYI